MKAIVSESLTKKFGHLVSVGRISFECVLTSSQKWKLTEEAMKSQDNCTQRASRPNKFEEVTFELNV